MPEVKVVTDSVSDLPDAVLSELGVDMVPLTVRFGTQEFLDRVDFGTDEFLERLVRTDQPVRTSQPPPGAFVEAFRKAGQEGRAVVSIQPSIKFSGTYQSACIARDIVAPEGYRVEVLDTRSASMGQGWAVIQAARAALAGQPLQKVVEQAREVSRRMRVFLTVDTLAYLHRNGRLGRVPAALGSLLNLKPILTVRDGELGLCDAVSGAERAFSRLVAIISRRIRVGARVALAVVHSAARDRAEQLRHELGRLYDVVESIITQTGPAIAANTGPGAYGAMLYEVD
ncbi:MAG: DegV family protein [Firmicutes bacterium]|nr:DegV family protein [Bacillota bacterium]